MTRHRSPLTTEFPIHIVARSNNQDWFQAPLDECWGVFSRGLIDTHQRFGFRTHAFVMMSNHYHWLVSNPDFKLAEGMCYFQSTTSRGIARAVKRINRVYGARYKPTIVSSSAHYANVLRYIYQNPLRAGICGQVEEYPWSTLYPRDLPIFRCEELDEFVPTTEFIPWLNQVPSENTNMLIQKGLRRGIFKMPRDREKQRQSGANFL